MNKQETADRIPDEPKWYYGGELCKCGHVLDDHDLKGHCTIAACNCGDFIDADVEEGC